MYFGIVKDIDDKEQLGRVKVNVYGCHDNIDTEDLSWSQVIMPGNTPAITGQGHSVNLAVGTLVCGIFLDETKQEFMIQGTLPTKTDGAFDNNGRVRSINPHAEDPTGEYEPPSAFAPEYPWNNVYETASGHAKEYDDTPNYERIMERHKSGTQYEIQPDGTKIERIVRDNYQLVIGHNTLEVFGNVRIIVSGQADIAVANDVNLAVGGNLTAEITGNGDITLKEGNLTTLVSKGNCDFTMTEGTTTIKSEGLIKLDANNVEITGDLRLSKEGITLNTHTHGQNNVDQPNTAGPNAN